VVEFLAVGKDEADVCNEILKALIMMEVRLGKLATNRAEIHWVSDCPVVVRNLELLLAHTTAYNYNYVRQGDGSIATCWHENQQNTSSIGIAP